MISLVVCVLGITVVGPLYTCLEAAVVFTTIIIAGITVDVIIITARNTDIITPMIDFDNLIVITIVFVGTIATATPFNVMLRVTSSADDIHVRRDLGHRRCCLRW